jgi:tRNA (cytidine/uridine-2'-O-)-methyltransferase
LGFRLTDEALKRSGMDYWQELDVVLHSSFKDFSQAFAEQFANTRVFSLTTKTQSLHSGVNFQANDVFIFGPESRGLPESIRLQTQALRIPMKEQARSLNLAVSAGIMMYEAWRQLEFKVV